MILSELLTIVKSTVNRPDLDALINQYVVDAVRAIHTVNEFDNDYVEWTIPTADVEYLTTDTSIGTFTYSRDVRIPKEVIALDAGGIEIAHLPILSFREVLRRKNGNISVVDTSYRNGDRKLSFQCSATPTSFILLGFTIRPEFNITNDVITGSTKAFTDTTLLAYSTWLMDTMPAVIMDYVIGYVASRVGEKDIANTHLSMYTSVHEPRLQDMGR